MKKLLFSMPEILRSFHSLRMTVVCRHPKSKMRLSLSQSCLVLITLLLVLSTSQCKQRAEPLSGMHEATNSALSEDHDVQCEKGELAEFSLKPVNLPPDTGFLQLPKYQNEERQKSEVTLKIPPFFNIRLDVCVDESDVSVQTNLIRVLIVTDLDMGNEFGKFITNVSGSQITGLERAIFGDTSKLSIKIPLEKETWFGSQEFEPTDNVFILENHYFEGQNILLASLQKPEPETQEMVSAEPWIIVGSLEPGDPLKSLECTLGQRPGILNFSLENNAIQLSVKACVMVGGVNKGGGFTKFLGLSLVDNSEYVDESWKGKTFAVKNESNMEVIDYYVFAPGDENNSGEQRQQTQEKILIEQRAVHHEACNNLIFHLPQGVYGFTAAPAGDKERREYFCTHPLKGAPSRDPNEKDGIRYFVQYPAGQNILQGIQEGCGLFATCALYAPSRSDQGVK